MNAVGLDLRRSVPNRAAGGRNDLTSFPIAVPFWQVACGTLRGWHRKTSRDLPVFVPP